MLKTKVQPSSLFVPIDSIERKSDGYFVSGYAFVNEVVEGENGVRIKASAMQAATPDYIGRGAGGVLREMHQPLAAGIVPEAIWDETGRCHIRAKVVDPVARLKCDEGVYKGFSIRVRPTVMRGLDVENLIWIETSLVDSPKDPDAVFTCFRVDDADGEGEAELLPEITELDGKFVLRLDELAPLICESREEAERLFDVWIARGESSGSVPIRENLEGTSKQLCPQCGTGMTCPQCGYGRSEGAGELSPMGDNGLPTIERVIKEEGGKFSVYSHDGEKKLGGPYDTREEAEKRLREVEYFKHKERVAGSTEPLGVLTDIFRLEDEHDLTLQRLTTVEADLARVRGEQEAATAALAQAKERIVVLENTPATAPPILHGQGAERRFAANETPERMELKRSREALLQRYAELAPMRPTEPDEQQRVAAEMMRITGELAMLAL